MIILSKKDLPIIGLPEIVKDYPAAIVGSGTQHDTWRTVSFRRHPSAMKRVRYQKDGNYYYKNRRNFASETGIGFCLLVLLVFGLFRGVHVFHKFSEQMRDGDAT